VLGLQFHLEMNADDIRRIARECADELVPGRYIQTADQMTSQARGNEPGTARLLDRMLSVLEEG
jgi:hypothetical protein